jgi:hypothetical protein
VEIVTYWDILRWGRVNTTLKVQWLVAILVISNSLDIHAISCFHVGSLYRDEQCYSSNKNRKFMCLYSTFLIRPGTCNTPTSFRNKTKKVARCLVNPFPAACCAWNLPIQELCKRWVEVYSLPSYLLLSGKSQQNPLSQPARNPIIDLRQSQTPKPISPPLPSTISDNL